MSLIEGIGDEVTLIFGLVFLAVIILFAWISTHTDDLSLFREVGVIVVELSQRRSRNRNNRTEDGTAELPPAGDQSATGSMNDGRDEANLVSPASSEMTNEQTPEPLELSALSESAGASVNAITSSNQSSSTDSSSSQETQTQQNESEVRNVSQEIYSSSSITPVVASPQGEAAVNKSTPSSQLPLDGEEIRQRRVHYFQGEGQDSQSQGNLSLGRSHVENSQVNHANVHRQNSKSNEEFNDTSSTDLDNLVDSNNRDRTQETDLVEDRPTTSSSNIETDSVLYRESPQQVGVSSDDLSNPQIRVKLKYMNETQRYVFAKPEDTIGDFRRTHFQSELEDNKWVRFIFNGQDLRDDARTLQACNVVNNSTMHCLVTARNRAQTQHDTAHEDEEDSMLGTLMYPLFTILLAIVWYFRFTYRQYFSAMSTVCLIGISFILALSYISSLRVYDSQPVQQPQQEAQPSSGNSNSGPSDSSSNQ